MNTNHLKPIIKSPIYILVILIILLAIFGAGMLAGYHKARFNNGWENGYARGMNPGMMDGPRSLFAPFFHDTDDINPHGAIGKIISVNLPLIMVKGQYEAEKVVIISSSTNIRFMRNQATSADLQVGRIVTIIGEPNDQGQINASFIRILPPPPMNPLQAGTSSSINK